MKYMIVFLSTLLFLLAETSNVSSSELDKKLHRQCIYPTVRIKIPNGSASGFIVKSNKVGDEYHNVVLTCGHTFVMGEIENDWNCKVGVGNYANWSEFEGFEMYPARIYGYDKELDLGVVLFSSKEKMPVAKLNFNKKLYIGSNVNRVGCGLGDETRIDYGKVTSIRGKIEGMLPTVNSIRTNVFTVPGDSGGPLFSKYEVVGIAQALRSVRMGWNVHPAFGISYHIPLSRLKIWDKEINTLGFVYKNEPTPVLPYLMMKVRIKSASAELQEQK